MKLSSIVLGTLLVVTACKSQANETPNAEPATAPAQSPEAAPAAQDGPKATVTVDSPEVKAGASATATVTFKPAAGFKWNLEYPAKLTFGQAGGKVELGKTAFHQLKGDFKATDEKATVTIPVSAKTAGEETLTAEARFSVCNDTTCLIEKTNVEVKVTVTP